VGTDPLDFFHIIRICRNLSQVIPLTVLIENDKCPDLRKTYAFLKVTRNIEKKHLKIIPKYFNATGFDSDLVFSVFELSTNNAGPLSVSEVCLLYTLI